MVWSQRAAEVAAFAAKRRWESVTRGLLRSPAQYMLTPHEALALVPSLQRTRALQTHVQWLRALVHSQLPVGMRHTLSERLMRSPHSRLHPRKDLSEDSVYHSTMPSGNAVRLDPSPDERALVSEGVDPAHSAQSMRANSLARTLTFVDAFMSHIAGIPRAHSPISRVCSEVSPTNSKDTSPGTSTSSDLDASFDSRLDAELLTCSVPGPSNVVTLNTLIHTLASDSSMNSSCALTGIMACTVFYLKAYPGSLPSLNPESASALLQLIFSLLSSSDSHFPNNRSAKNEARLKHQYPNEAERLEAFFVSLLFLNSAVLPASFYHRILMASSSSSGNAVNQLTASKLAFCTLNKFISSSFESSPHLRVRKLSQEAIDSLFNSVPVLNTPADEEFVKHIKQAASRFITLCTRSWIKQRNAALPRIFIPTGPNAATTVRFLARCIPAAAGSPSFSLEEASALLRACEKANKKRRENEFLTASILEPHMGMAQRCLQSDRDVSATMRAVFHLERAWKIHENHCRLRIPQKSPVPRLLALYLDARMRLTMQSGTPATDVVMNMLQKIVMGVFGVVVVQEKTWVRLMQDFGIDKRRVLVKVLQANRGVVEGNVRILGNQLLADQAMISATEESSGIVSSPLEAKDRWAFDLITGRGSRDIVTMVVLIQRALEVDADDKAARQVYEEACSDLEPSLLLENVDKMLLPLLRWYALRKDKEGCAWVINEMEQRGIWGTMKAFTVQACAYASTRDWELVKDLYDERVRAGLKPDIVFFAALVKIAADQSLPWVVEEWLGRMQERGVKPDSVTRKSAIIALAQNHRGQYPDLEFLRRAEEHLVALETEAGETEYEDVTAHYGILMRSYARLRNSAKVTDIMARYSIFLSRTNRHDNGAILDPELLDTYVYCLLDCNEWSLARDCLLELHSRRKQPASDRTKSCLCLLLESAPLEQLPLVDEVLQASDLRLVSKFGLAPLSDTSVNASLLIGRLARTPARDPDGSLERYARELWAALPREMSLNHAALTRAIKVCKTAKRARWWMDEFEAVDAEVRVNGVIQNAYLSICARDPEMRLAQLRALVTELSARLVPHTGVMKSKKMEVGTLYVVLTSRAAREGNVVAVEEILSEFESTRVMDDLDVRLLCSAPLLSVYTRATKYEKVDALWNDFCGDSITVPLLGHEAFVCLYLDSFGFRNDVEGLCSLWRTLIQKADEGAVVAGVEQFWKAPSGRFFITENHCNSYLEALLRVGACDEAVRTAKCMGAAASLHGSSAYAEASQRIVGKTHLARISPTRKMLVTILGGLETQKRWDLLREFDEWRKMAWTIMQ